MNPNLLNSIVAFNRTYQNKSFDENHPAVKKLLDPNVLPTRGEVSEAFGSIFPCTEEWVSTFSNADNSFRKYVSCAGATNTTTAEGEFSRDDWQKCFWAFCLKHNIYDIYTVEYISALAEYLMNTYKNKGGSITIAEVGAGNGRLTHFLRQNIQMKKLRSGCATEFKICACDDFSFMIDSKVTTVERCSSQDALERWAPEVVLCAWMPQGEDWSVMFRRTSSVQEYILIGEAGHDAACGDEFTWGIATSEATEDISGQPPEYPPCKPFLVGGFVCEEVAQCSQLQLSRSDGMTAGYSHTMSFKRSEACSQG